MKVMIFANNDIGLYKFRKELIQELVKSNDVYICLPDGEYVSKLEELGCKYISCNEMNRRGMNPIEEIKLICFYKRIIRKVIPDVVLTYTIKPNAYCGAVCAKLGIPYIANITGLGTSIENGGIVSKITLSLYKYGLRKAQKVFFQNNNNLKFMIDKGVVGDKFEILPGSGVNLSENCYETYPDENEGIRFLFVGRIMKDKGIHEYLECAKQIHRSYPNCTFDIVGSYDDECYRTLIEQYETEKIVHHFGQQKDVHSFMKSHHILIHPSYHEGLSNVLLEAAACGRPVIASNIPGCKETFEEGISGFGFEVKNADSLVTTVERILALKTEEREKMGICGRKKVEKEFSREIIVDAYLRELHSI